MDDEDRPIIVPHAPTPLPARGLFASTSMASSLSIHLPATAACRILNFVRLVLLTWWMTAEQNGLFNTLLPVINILTPLCSLGLNEAVTRYVPHYESRGSLYEYLRRAFSLVLITSLVCIVVALTAALLIGSGSVGAFADDPTLRKLLRLQYRELAQLTAAVTMLLICYFFLLSAFKGLRMYVALSLMEFVHAVLFLLLAGVFAWRGHGSAFTMTSCYALSLLAAILLFGLPFSRRIRQTLTSPGGDSISPSRDREEAVSAPPTASSVTKQHLAQSEADSINNTKAASTKAGDDSIGQTPLPYGRGSDYKIGADNNIGSDFKIGAAQQVVADKRINSDSPGRSSDYSIEPDFARRMFRFSLWATLAAVTWQLLLSYPTLYLSKVHDKVSVAIFSNMRQIGQIILTASVAVVAVVLSQVTRNWEQHGPARARQQLSLSLRAGNLLLLAACAAVLFLRPFIMRMYPPQYGPGAQILSLQLLSFLIAAHMAFLTVHFSLIEKTRHLFWPWAIGVAANVVLGEWLLNRRGPIAGLGLFADDPLGIAAASWAGLLAMAAALLTCIALLRSEGVHLERSAWITILAAPSLLLPALWLAALLLFVLAVTLWTDLVFNAAERARLTQMFRQTLRLGARPP